MRRIVRRNLKYGGEILELTWRKIKHKPRPLVIICDISGSMSLYSRLLLHFIHTISNGLLNVEAFVFGTRLTRITRQLKKRDVVYVNKEGQREPRPDMTGTLESFHVPDAMGWDLQIGNKISPGR